MQQPNMAAPLLLTLSLPLLFLSSAGASPSSSTHPPSVVCSPTEVARAAVSLSLDAAKVASTYLSRVSKGGGPGSAMQDCVEKVGDGVNVLLKSVGELDKIGQQGSHHNSVHVGNVQMWASTALTDAEICLRSLSEAQADDNDVARVIEEVTLVLKLIGNTLVLINHLAPKN